MVRFLVQNKKRAVSPVIAIVLLIALTVAAAGTVFIIFNSLVVDAPEFILTLEESKDHNNDGLVDYMKFNVLSLSGEEQNISYVSLEYWYLAQEKIISPNGEVQVEVYTSQISAQLAENAIVDIGVSPFVDSFFFNKITVGKASLAPPVIITVTAAGSPVVGTLVSFTFEDGTPAPIAPLSTDANGQVEVYLLPGVYIAKTSSGLESSPFNNIYTKSVSISESNVETFYVKILDTAGAVMQGVTVYATDNNQNDMGLTSITNSSGLVKFTMTQGSYLFRINYLSQDYWSSSVIVPGVSNSVVTIQIKAGYLAGTINFNAILPGSGYRLYLYTANNVSLNINVVTDINSQFNFTSGVTSGLFRLRLRSVGNNYVWSSIVSTSTADLQINFGGGNLNIKIMTGSVAIPNNVRVYLFNAAGSYVGRSDRTNASGVAEFGLLPGINFKIRVDWLGYQTYSLPFYHDDSLMTIDLGGGTLNVLITTGGLAVPANVRVYLFTAAGSYSGRSDRTNATGWAEFGAILGAGYKVRVDWLGQQTYSNVFNHTDESPQYVDLSGGRLDVLITAGGTPIPANVRVYLFTAAGAYTGRSDRTNATGWAELGSILGSDYKVRVDWLGTQTYSPVFTHANNSSQLVQLGGGRLDVSITSGGTPLPANVRVYLFTAAGAYTGVSDRTNATGWAELGVVISNNYKIRVDWLGSQIYSSVFNHIDSTPQSVEVGGGLLNVLITAGGLAIPANVRIYLFTAGGAYTGVSDRTNGTGYAEFGVIAENNYKIRVDWLGYQTYSNVFNHNATVATHEVALPGGNLVISIKIGGSNIPNNVRIYLFTATNVYTGASDRTNATGFAEFGVILGQSYKIRADYLSKQYYSTVFTHNGSSSYNITYSGIGSMTINVNDNTGTPLVDGQWVYLFHSDGTYTGLRTQVSSGQVVFFTIPDGSYMLRWYNGAANVYTTAFTAATLLTEQFP